MDYWRTTTRLEQALPRTRRIGVVEREMVPSKISILPTNSPTNLPTDSLSTLPTPSLCKEVRETSVVPTTITQLYLPLVYSIWTDI